MISHRVAQGDSSILVDLRLCMLYVTCDGHVYRSVIRALALKHLSVFLSRMHMYTHSNSCMKDHLRETLPGNLRSPGLLCCCDEKSTVQPCK